MKIERCYDADFIDTVMLSLLPQISTDQYPAFVSARGVLQHPDFTFVSVEDEAKMCGLVMLVRDEVHTMFLPCLRGKRALQAARAILDWLWRNTDLPQIRSYAYSNRPEVKLFARWMGFHITSVEDDGSTVNGVPVTKTNLAINRP